jgi:hypothetical protein
VIGAMPVMIQVTAESMELMIESEFSISVALFDQALWLNATTQSITEGLIDNSLARVLGCEPLPVMIPVIE